MSRVQNVPAIVRLIRLGPGTKIRLFIKVMILIVTCPANAGTAVDDHGGSEGVAQPWGSHHSYHLGLVYILMIVMMTTTMILMTMLDLFLPDALKELQHGEGGVGGAIVRPARELEV